MPWRRRGRRWMNLAGCRQFEPEPGLPSTFFFKTSIWSISSHNGRGGLYFEITKKQQPPDCSEGWRCAPLPGGLSHPFVMFGGCLPHHIQPSHRYRTLFTTKSNRLHTATAETRDPGPSCTDAVPAGGSGGACGNVPSSARSIPDHRPVPETVCPSGTCGNRCGRSLPAFALPFHATGPRQGERQGPVCCGREVRH
jgi:hypothetical protein